MSDSLMDETFHCKWHFTGIESQKKYFLKNCSKSIPQGKIFVSQGQNEIAVVRVAVYRVTSHVNKPNLELPL